MKLNRVFYQVNRFISELLGSVKNRIVNRWGVSIAFGIAITLISIAGLISTLAADTKVKKPVQLYAAFDCKCLPGITIRPSENNQQLLVKIGAPSTGCGYKRTKLLIVTFAEMREIKSQIANQQLENYKFHFLEPREYAWSDMDGHAIIANIGDDNFPSIEFKIVSGIYKLAFDEFCLHFDFRREPFFGIIEDVVEQKLKEFNIPDEVTFSIELLPPYELTSSIPNPASINFTQEFPQLTSNWDENPYYVAYQFNVQRGQSDLIAVFGSDERRRIKEMRLIIFSTLFGFGIGLVLEVFVELLREKGNAK
ncbi:MAG: hypothetical protein ACREOI_12640 [bacterium]